VRIRIATRGSALARWQAEHVAGCLRTAGVSEIELVIVETTADRRLDIPIEAMGGKGVFVKEVQAAVLDGRADLAVHSAKDLPARTPDGLVIAAVPERADPHDVLVGARLADLAPGAHIATGSVRRKVQLAERRSDLRFSGLRGNIATRLSRLGEFDAIVMAKAALDRLELTPDVVDVLDVEVMLPQVGQGALAVECRAADGATRELLARIEHAPSRRTLDTERAFLDELGGDCDLPAGAHAVLDGQLVTVHGMLAARDASTVLREHATGDDPDRLGRAVARALVARGGGALAPR
jgi:hydroxymethylbilane synthase